MPTDTERREVARRLRSFVTDDSVYADVDACHVLYSIGLYYKDVDRIYFSGIDVARLADLIEPESERTCHVESSHVEHEIGDYSYLEVELSCGHSFTWDDGTPPDYCPFCGARVIREETDDAD